jgi:hypothetical protein
MAKKRILPIRGYLLHLTHYDPRWFLRKAREKPFDIDLGLEVVDALAEEGFNTLLIGISDGVKFKSHPEYAKPYSVPRSTLTRLVKHARKRGMQIVPKLNFSRSEIHTHNHWMRPKGSTYDYEFDTEAHWKKAFEVIDECIEICAPERFFHVGMDEDSDRSYSQYITALRTLRQGVKQRKLKMVAWSDSSVDYDVGNLYQEKSQAAEATLPTDSVRLLWNYWRVPTAEAKAIRERKFELWGAPGQVDPRQVRQFRDLVLGLGGTGLIMTQWMACRKPNRKKMLDTIHKLGPVYRGEG